MKFPTMTIGGMYGKEYEADTPEAAAVMAEKDGENVLDLFETSEEVVIVVAD